MSSDFSILLAVLVLNALLLALASRRTASEEPCAVEQRQ